MEQFLIYLLKSSGITALFLLFYVLLLRRETFFKANRIYLMVGLGLSIVLPLMVITKTVWLQPTPINPSNMENFVMAPLSKETPLDWFSLLFYGYIAGVFLFMMRFAIQLLSLYRLISNSITFKDGKFIKVETNKNVSPFSFFRYVVYNPNLHSPSELHTILLHERIHVQRNHSLDIVVMHLFTIFQWCNPFIWWYRASMDNNLEYMADTETIALNTNRTEYQYLLLRTGVGERHYSLVTPFFNSSIKKRINMLNKNRSNRKNEIKYTLMLPFLMAFIFMFNIKTEARVKALNQLSSPIESTEAQLKTLNPLLIPFGTLKDSIQKVYQIKKGTTDIELSDMVDEIAGQGGVLKIKDLKRNKTGLIAKIALSYKINDQGFVSGNYQDPNGIETIYFGRSKINGQFIVGENEKRDEKIILYGSPKPNSGLNEGLEKVNNYEYGEVLSGTGVRKAEGNNKSTVIIHDSLSGHPLAIGSASGVKLDIGDQDDSLILMDGKEISKNEMDKIDPETIKSVEIWKGPKSIEKYGDKGKDGVIEITMKKNNSNLPDNHPGDGHKAASITLKPHDSINVRQTGTDKTSGIKLRPGKENPLIILDGKETSKSNFEKIKPEDIESVVVLKGQKAIDKYGDTAKDGVIEVKTKSANAHSAEAKAQSPWKVSAGPNISDPNGNLLEHYGQMDKMAPLESRYPDIDKALILINGIPSAKKDLELISVNQIKMFFPIPAANKEAIKKYGDQAKNGVIEIVLKKE
ncbi:MULTISPECIES: M56 family metallopeptidase [unclassified Arenibacter]|uniref:M56 family metallopeptidase n=1 Tax=unclassified Arenibacter TaxID=2615047 RepID=UPI000E355453|nr:MULTISPECIES: M56 family metallopeptidase [unclassified Arenibacter]MCM4164654.1 hypothetical protein [Arenibacter sp. A80]RFT55731.1 M56 family peptidase [Arenibacter sp. P308M17]